MTTQPDTTGWMPDIATIWRKEDGTYGVSPTDCKGISRLAGIETDDLYIRQASVRVPERAKYGNILVGQLWEKPDEVTLQRKDFDMLLACKEELLRLAKGV